jgi:dUTP pyrophosphatase
MKAKIQRVQNSTELPKYHTAGSAGFDIAAYEDFTVQAGQVYLARTGLIIQAPEGHFLMLAARSSLAIKKGLKLANGIGIIDRDYCGPEDEIKLILHNFTSNPVEIKKGERIAQGLFVPVTQAELEEVSQIKDDSRGGTGSSGGYHG